MTWSATDTAVYDAVFRRLSVTVIICCVNVPGSGLAEK